MKIRECLDANHIYVGVDLPDKEAVLAFLAEKASASGLAVDAATLFSGFQEREMSFTTGIGLGIALPHTTSSQCQKTTLFLLRLASPVDFDSIDELPVDVVLALIIPITNPSEHLQILARTARLCKQQTFPEALRQSPDAETLWEAIRRFEKDAEIAWYGGEV
ncbi:PTS sugar transporter subunit IIA [Desulfoluna sp.]|uniref:PTS sugar transporter subunit IIA n=1 Tax=Desulfoluna sp. TaxID=2045199 RepID=UPI00262281EF|nr:PTS sugar transporter subunit IIA [Desulfoluna sp.]